MGVEVMKCRDCSEGMVVKCPECDKSVIVCGEDYQIFNFKYWDNELNFCDGIDDG